MGREKVIKMAERIMRSTVDRDMIDSFCENVIDLLTEHETEYPVCEKCGKETIRCKNCNNPIDKDNWNFCPYCGFVCAHLKGGS